MAGKRKDRLPEAGPPPPDWPWGELPPVEAYQDDVAAEPPEPSRNGHAKKAEGPGTDARLPIGFRTLPHNLDAEQALLGAILINNDAYHEVSGFLRPEHFYEPVHGRIFAAIKGLIDQGRLADPVTMGEIADQDPDLRQIGGRQHLADMAMAAVTVLNADHYGRLIYDLYVRRGVIAIAEAASNQAFDPTAADSATKQLESVREQLERLTGEASAISVKPCELPAVNLSLVQDGLFEPQRWIIEEWLPVGCAGIFSGPGSAGKSYLELIRMVCLAAGIPFLGFKLEPIVVLGYFAEESSNDLAIRLDRICRALQVSPAGLEGRLNVVSTRGQHIRLFEADRNALAVTPTDYFKRIVERAQRIGARYLPFDNLARYCAIDYHVNNQQVFDLFTYLDQVASELNGCITLLNHPSKSGLKSIRDATGDVSAYDMVGGCTALVNAPRVVQTLRWFQPAGEGEQRFRLLQKHKRNIGREIALKLVENDLGIVENREELDPQDLRSRSFSRGSRSSADRTLIAFEDMWGELRREITLDELVRECIKRGIIAEAEEKSEAWRGRRKTIREHMERHRKVVDIRDGERYAAKP